MQYNASLDRDANRVPIGGGTMPFVQRKSRTYTGAAGLGATGATTLFTVTGDVLARVFATVQTDLAGATATIEVGVASGTALLLAQTTATLLVSPKNWIDASPALAEQPNFDPFIVGKSQNIIETIATANITAGVLSFYCFWRPLSFDGLVQAT